MSPSLSPMKSVLFCFLVLSSVAGEVHSQSVQSIAEELSASTVILEMRDMAGRAYHGSGFFIGIDRERDVAVLKVSERRVPVLSLEGRCEKCVVGHSEHFLLLSGYQWVVLVL